MKRYIVFALLLSLLVQPLWSVQAEEDFPPIGEVAPLSEEFLYYLEHPEEFSSGYVPPADTVVTEDEEGYFSYEMQAALPAKFDLRTENRVTAVRSQGTLNTCWAFASIAALESYLMPRVYDFSENHLANHSGYYNPKILGGNMRMGLAYFNSGRGPVDESQDPYGGPSLIRDLPTLSHVRTAYYINDAQIKQMIYRYGGVQTAIRGAQPYSPYYNQQTASQYVPSKLGQDHEVLIVGWDDDYPKENFNAGTQPSRNGAWIVKNSWGEHFGERGYYYVSYEDKTIGGDNLVYIDAREPNWYDHLYQHDEYGKITGYGYERTDSHWFANIFTAQAAEEYLRSVAFYASEPNLAYEVWIKNDYQGTFDHSVMAGSGKLSHAGYHTLDLADPIRVKGRQFAVMVKIYAKQPYPIPIERNVRGNSNQISIYEVVANPGESFISPDGTRWKDISAEGMNVCLKAFTTHTKNQSLRPPSQPDVPVPPAPVQEPEQLKSAVPYGRALSTSDVQKVWTIRLNQELRSDRAEIKVYEDETFREISIDTRISGKNVLITPREQYRRGKDYYIYIGRLESLQGSSLRTKIKAKFRVN